MVVTWLVVGLVIVLGAGSEPTRLLCPLHCRCTYSGYSQGVARCSRLQPDLQNFSHDLRQVILQDSPLPLNLTSDFFLKLGLKDVLTIKIINSTISNLDVNAFRGLRVLTHVDLIDNKLILINPDTFKTNRDLQKLRFSGNPLQLTQSLASKYVLKSDSVTELDISHCQLTQLSEHAFSQLNNLDVLILSHNNLHQINPEVFSSLDELEEIDLSYNNLSNITSDTFKYPEELISLSLRGNPLKTFDLPNLPELEELDLSYCSFRSIAAETFEGVIDVSNLNLSHNAIEIIDSDAFTSLPKLRYLDLSHNKLKASSLSVDLLENNENLETISFARNRGLKSAPSFIGEFSLLYMYDLSDCGLEEINSKAFHGMHLISSLNISNNNIIKIEPKTFSDLPRLNVLDLSNNLIHSLHPNVFASNRELRFLYLSGNELHHLSAAMFRPLPKLYVLDVSYNSLRYLWNKSESDIMKTNHILGELTHFNLRGNRFRHLYSHSFISMQGLTFLDIYENPFECSANLVKTIEWLATQRISPSVGKSNHPISINEGSNIENNRKWVTLMHSFCPETIDLTTSRTFGETTKTFGNIYTYFAERHPEERFSSVVYNSFLPTSTPAAVVYEKDGVREYEYEAVAESEHGDSLLTIITVFLFLVMFASLNIVLLIYLKSRSSYTLVGYKTVLPTPSFPHKFPLRKGHRNEYQKLYKECTEPNPEHNSKRVSIISIFGQSKRSGQDV